ncbi:MAG: molecular chaperone HtpG [Bacteroidota bacterium]
MNEKGTISVHTENIFPIIKKFLYSDQEVFLRELVSNAVDATQKLKQLAAMGKYEGNTDQLQVTVRLDEKRKTITVSDQGVGMTAEEIKKYINQVAFSGATEFLEQYKDQDQQQQLIGFFGLGFYAAFMVADKVEIITKSYQKDAEAAHWTCEGTTQFELTKTVKKEVGTDVILHLAEDAKEFLQKEKIQQLLDKYCKFLPTPIELDGKVTNNPHPIWSQSPSALADKDYLAFYKELYPFAEDPLFWIHLNVDYPFNLTGVLYFPKITNNFEQHQNKIQLYAKQVFITNEVKNVVPEFLMLLHGVLDSPDIPLNVSRSALQADSNVKKINTYIAKKVGDKLADLFKHNRKAYEEKWNSIALFVKYGMFTNDKFYEKAKGFTLLRNTAGSNFTLEEYQEKIKANQTDKNQNLVILYATAPEKQDQYIQSCKKRSYDVVVLDQPIDQHFINFLEQKLDKVTLKGVDSAPVEQLIGKDTPQESALTDEEKKRLQALYTQAVPNKQVTWSTAAMAADEMPVIITVPEFAKRMYMMSNSDAMATASLALQATINTNHPLALKLLRSKKEEKQLQLALQAYRLALLAQDMLNGSERTAFAQHNIDMLVSL